MKKGWKMVPMGKLCTIKNGKSNTEDAKEDGAYAFFDRSKKIKRSSRYLYDCEALIIPGEGAEFLPRHFIGKFDLHQRAYALFDFSKSINVMFLFYYLTYFKDYFTRVAVGATVKSLRLRHFEQLPVPVPPLSEQQRIVSILDKVFSALAIAKTSTTKNLQNAVTLFEARLQTVFIQRTGWNSLPFEECIESVKYTTRVKRKEFLEKGKYPIVSQEADLINGYWDDTADIFKVIKPVVIFGDHTKVLKFVDFDFVLGADGVKILLPKRILDSKFFFYNLRSIQLKTLGYSRHYRLLKELHVNFPDISEQLRIAKDLEILEQGIRRIAILYEHKLAVLEELKKSLLHQAFSGGL